MKTNALAIALLAGLAVNASAAAAQDAPVDQAIASCAQAMMAPDDVGPALEAGGFAKTAGTDAATYARDGVTVVIGPGKQCSVTDAAAGSAAMFDKLSALGTLPEDKDDAGCRRFDLGSGAKVSVTGGDAKTCEADKDGTLRFVVN